MNKLNFFNRSPNPKDPLCIAERVGYAFGNTGMTFSYILVLGFMTFYYTDIIGISAGVVGTIMLISRVFDGISDLIMGTIIDKTKTKIGKARPWILIAAVPNAVMCTLAFAVPTGWTDMRQYIYIFLTYNLLNAVTYTASNVSVFSANCMLTDNPREHAQSGIWMQIGGSLTMLIVQYSCVSLVAKLGDTPDAWTKAVAVYATIGAVLMVISGLMIRERVVSEGNVLNGEKIPFFTRLKELFRNKYWILYTAVYTLFTVLEQGTGSGALYYANYIMGDSGAYAVFSTAQTAIQIIVLIVGMTFILRKVGNVSSVIICFILTGAASIIQWFFWSMEMVIFCSILRGLAYAFFLGSQGAIIADLCSFGTKKAGFGMEGIGNAGISFGYKCGAGIGMALVGWILQIFGYDGTATVQTAGGLLGIKAIYLGMPLIICVVCVLLMLPFDMYKRAERGEIEL